MKSPDERAQVLFWSGCSWKRGRGAGAQVRAVSEIRGGIGQHCFCAVVELLRHQAVREKPRDELDALG